MSPPRKTADKRVVLVTELFPPDTGGSAMLFGNVYPRLHDQSVTVIRHAEGTPDVTSAGALRMLGVPMRASDWGVTNLASLRRYSQTVQSLARECRREPSIVHCGRALHEGLAALLASQLTRSKYLCWAHGEELLYPRGSRELTFLLGRVLRGAAALLANSHNTARELANLGVPPTKVHVVHPGVDATVFDAVPRAGSIRERYVRGDELLMLTVGRLQTRKGHDLAIEALARGGRSLDRVRYVIVGDGDERARLERQVQESGLSDRVHFTGEVSTAVLREYYATADFFVHPNRQDGNDVEGFGIVFLEAAAAGLPTIGGKTGGVPEAVQDGATGLLVGGNDADELAAAIGTLATSELLRRRMGEAGKLRVRQYFTWERAAAQVSEVHRGLAAA